MRSIVYVFMYCLHINNRPHRLMKTSSIAVETSRSTSQSDSIVRQTNKTFIPKFEFVFRLVKWLTKLITRSETIATAKFVAISADVIVPLLNQTEIALPLLNLLELLTVQNIFKLKLRYSIYKWHTKQLPNIFDHRYRYASDVHTHNTRYTSKSNLYKTRLEQT